MSQLNLFESYVGPCIKSETDKKRERISELRRTVHNYWNDPGHAWLEVRQSDLKLLGIEKEISGYSYQDNKGLDGAAYLEEDCDAGKYIRALWPGELINGPEFQMFRTHCIIDKYQENIFVRRLRHYSPGKRNEPIKHNPYLDTDCMGNCYSDADPGL